MILFIIIFLYAFHPFSFLLGVFCKYPEFFFSNLMTGGWMDSRSIVILIKFSIKIHSRAFKNFLSNEENIENNSNYFITNYIFSSLSFFFRFP